VLAEAAREVAARRTEREHRAAGKEMIQRLLFDRVDAEATRTAVRREHDPVVFSGPDETHTALALAQLARARAYVALHSSVGEVVPVLRGNGRRRGHCASSVAPRWTLSNPGRAFRCLQVDGNPDDQAPGHVENDRLVGREARPVV